MLPKHVPLLAVGGVGAANMADYLAAGVSGFGLGTSLFTPGAPDEIGRRAAEIVAAAYDAAVRIAI